MEKKTIGKFIAALRKANGMTQKELGEKLFVSDKTVSRWERDECEPELSVLPAMAELFGVTTDELIRGERIPATPVLENFSPEHSNSKTEKQLKRMLNSRLTTYKNCLLISLGIAAFGFLLAVICNFAFYRGILGFCLSAVGFVAAILTICAFSNAAYLKNDDEEDFFIEKQTLLEFHSSLTKLCLKCVTACIGVFASTLPFAFVGSSYYGLNFLPWLLYGAICVAVVLFVCFIVYKTLLEKRLTKKEYLILTSSDVRKNALRKKILRRQGIPCAILLAVFLVGSFVCEEVVTPFHIAEKTVFSSYEIFKAFMETYEEDELWKDIILDEDGFRDTYHTNIWQTIEDANGNVLCRFEWNNRSVYRYEASDSNGGLPIFVYTNDAYYNANGTLNMISSVCLFLAVADVGVFAILYILKMRPEK